MTTKDRILRVINHKEADRVPIIDTPWEGTVSRWLREGMPDATSLAWIKTCRKILIIRRGCFYPSLSVFYLNFYIITIYIKDGICSP